MYASKCTRVCHRNQVMHIREMPANTQDACTGHTLQMYAYIYTIYVHSNITLCAHVCFPHGQRLQYTRHLMWWLRARNGFTLSCLLLQKAHFDEAGTCKPTLFGLIYVWSYVHNTHTRTPHKNTRVFCPPDKQTQKKNISAVKRNRIRHPSASSSFTRVFDEQHTFAHWHTRFARTSEPTTWLFVYVARMSNVGTHIQNKTSPKNIDTNRVRAWRTSNRHKYAF